MKINVFVCFVQTILLTFCFSFTSAYGQHKMTREKYVSTYKNIAISNMQKYKIPASITLAQGILESGCGGSILATDANNHFGIKCHTEWNGKVFFYDDDEKNECFRVYSNAEESFYDHSLFLTTRSRYKPLFDLDITDYKSWAYGLKKAGYATNPEYAHALIKIIEEQNLTQFDQMALHQELFVETNSKFTATYIPKNILPEYRKLSSSINQRELFDNNGIKCTIAKENDSYFRIAKDLGIYSYQLFNYNEHPKNKTLKTGEVVYLEKKKKKGVVAYYFVQQGETVLDIAQKTGMTTKSLCKKNRIKKDSALIEGTMLWLVKKKP